MFEEGSPVFSSSPNEINYSKEKSPFTLTNRETIESLPTQTESEKNSVELKYLSFLTAESTTSYSKLKKNLGLFLNKSLNFFQETKSFARNGIENKKILNYQKNCKFNELLNKRRAFTEGINNFNLRLKSIKEKQKESKLLVDYLKVLKHLKFILNENVDIDKNDIFLDLSKFTLQYQTIKNFSKLINIKDSNFSIIKKFIKGNDYIFELKSDFYNEFNSKYKLYFDIKLKLQKDCTLYVNDDIFEMIIISELSKSLHIIDKDKINNISNLLKFYYKYLLYKFLKEEIKQAKKYMKNINKSDNLFLSNKSNFNNETSFEINGFNFILKKYPNSLIIRTNYMDNLTIEFSISKLAKDKNSGELIFINKIKESSYLKDTYKTHELNDLRRMGYFHLSGFIIPFFSNLLHHIQLNKKITNFVSEVVRNENPTLEDFVKNTIIINNLRNISLIFLREEANFEILKDRMNLINKINRYKISVSNSLFPNAQTLGVYHFFIEPKKIFSYRINPKMMDLFFDKSLNVTIKLRDPFKNNILCLDRLQTMVIERGRVNFTYLYDIIRQYLN